MNLTTICFWLVYCKYMRWTAKLRLVWVRFGFGAFCGERNSDSWPPSRIICLKLFQNCRIIIHVVISTFSFFVLNQEIVTYFIETLKLRFSVLSLTLVTYSVEHVLCCCQTVKEKENLTFGFFIQFIILNFIIT